MIQLPANLAVVSRDPTQVRETARDILERREFRDEQTLGQRISDWLQDPLAALDRLLARLQLLFGGGDGAVAATAAWGFAIVVALLVVFLVVKFARTTTASEVAEAKLPVTKLRNANDLLSEAEQFEAQGDWRRAIRARHAALVVALAERGVLRRQPGMTAREYAIEVSNNVPNAYPPFDAATLLFEKAWYGREVPSANEAAHFKELAADVQSKVVV